MKRYNIGKSLGRTKILVSILIAFTLLVPSFGLATDQNPEPLKADVEDDCETSEVIIDDILSPASHVNTGKHDITASFTSVAIKVNGQYDKELNEPWREHIKSPDTTGTPQAYIYTSCDEDYMYIAFENFSECDQILAGEIFLDMNDNQTWDEEPTDTFLTFTYPNIKVHDNMGDPIDDSLVAWGNFVEIQIPKTIWSDCNNWGYRISSLAQNDCLVSLPDEPITAQIAEDYTDSYFDITLSDITGDYDVENGVYDGWCIEYGPHYTPEEHPVTLHSSACEEDISFFGIPFVNWSKANYILNNDLEATYSQKQHAIWHFINVGSQEPSPPDSTTQQLIDNADMYGAGFIPSPGEVLAVLVNPVGREYQHTIIEVTVPCEEDSWNPNWGDNDHPSDTPPDNEFLEFVCSYWYDCECGIAFKGLADIWRINPGECRTLFSTTFENETNVSVNWIAKSFDSNPDTWNLSTNRSHSSSNSFHCTNKEQYYGNAIDVLETKIDFDFTDVVNFTFSFWHWAEGDSYSIDGQTQIADYGTVEYYLPEEDMWISLQNLALTTQYYNNNWKLTSFTIDETKEYDLSGDTISGDDLMQNGNKFRFNWTSDPQFQYEGWYIDDVSIEVCSYEWYDPKDDLVFQSQSLGPDHWCAPWNSTVEKTFPSQWDAEEGKYLLNVTLQEEPPWCGQSWMEKIIIVGDIHDVAVIDVDPPAIVEPGDDVDLSATIKNVGTLDETDVEVHAKLRKDGTGSPIWERSTTINSLNVSETFNWEFTWEDATYCDYELEVTAFVENDEVPSNNVKYKWILVADTLFLDHMNDKCNWSHIDLTGGPGHWNICTSGYDDYLWCGLQDTTKYDNNFNDVAMINETFNITDNSTLTISFETQYQINESDFGIIEMSPDNGRHWYPISSEITGFSDWTTLTLSKDVSSEDIEKAKIRFRFYSNESITDRGWIIDDIIVKTDGFTIFEEDIDTNGVDNFIIERLTAGDWWQLKTKAKPGQSDNTAWWCGDELDGMYPNNLNNALFLNGKCADDIDLSKAFAADLIFNTWYDLKDGDIGYIELSTNDGSSWTEIGKVNGTSDSWEQVWIPIDDYLGETIFLRFRFSSDNSNNAEGWYVDDVRIVAKIDENPPTTTAQISGTMGENNWYTSTVTVSLSATDDHSGVDDIYYILDDGSTSTYSSPISVSTDGDHTIEYWAVDNVGNTETSQTESFKIDKTDPETPTITKPDTGIYLRDKKIWPLIDFSLFSWDPPKVFGAITVIADTSDDTSGVDTVEFFVDGDYMDQDQTVPYEWNWDETVFLTHTVKVRVTDNAGNTAEATKDIFIFNINLF